ncbi:uncharacterized protein LOC132727199 [Ruditapes philippinarum]|uniref:uncharacterized protein LOC132727199 n=1 Tax=Ruditapes philippinarum TaxID=129788 RepID=UPI00295A7BAA|nr:uncharacterized protein LOC132727199 [Ruditapes philippinarum]
MDEIMCVVKTVAMVTVLVAVTSGLICQNPDCEYVQCDPVNPDNCTGTMRLGGGLCGCCKACFTCVGLGEPCESGDSLHAMFYPPTVLCDTGLYCDDKNLTCVAIEDTYFG